MFEFELISFLFTLLIRRQKLALIMLFAVECRFNCFGHKNLKKGILAANYFQLDGVGNLVHLPHC